MFPFYNNMRYFLGATVLVTLYGVMAAPAIAATPLVRQIPTEAIGDAAAIDDSARPAATAPIHLSFALANFNKTALDDYAAGVIDKHSPLYHKWLKPDELGPKFGAPINDISKVITYLKAEGFSGVKVWPDHMFISAHAPRATVEQALSVKIHGYDRDAAHVREGYSKTFYAPDSTPTVLADIASDLKGVFGLSDKVQRIPTLARRADGQPEITTNGLQPVDVSEVYQTAPLHAAGFTGAGETIAIFSPTTYAASDVAQFETENNITGTNINIVNVNGGATDGDDADEACLDIEETIGQAPSATVNVYEGPNDGSFDIFNQMEADDPDIVSESYGGGEDEVDSAYAASYETIREAMSTEGISIFVSSGDTGAFGDPDEPSVVTVSVDTSSAYVTSVGGTELLPFLNTNQWNGEQSWAYGDMTTEGQSGSGGGLSIYYPKPSWQIGTGVDNQYSNGMRQVPDVAACASTPFYAIVTGGQDEGIGGTSASCPVWASSISLIEEQLGLRLGCINPELYAIAASQPSVYHDIIGIGGDGVYPCTVGWDFVTGWGSANFNDLSVGFAQSDAFSFGPGLQMISVPYAYATTDSVSSLFSGLVTSTGVASSEIAAWVPLYQNYVVTPNAPANTPVPGQGYWARFNGSTGGALTSLGTAISTPYYGITLQPGWNMVGDPYTTPVQISNLQVQDANGNHTFAQAVAIGDINPNFYSYSTESGYVQNSAGATLTPFAGYWVYVSHNIQLTFVPS